MNTEKLEIVVLDHEYIGDHKEMAKLEVDFPLVNGPYPMGEGEDAPTFYIGDEVIDVEVNCGAFDLVNAELVGRSTPYR